MELLTRWPGEWLPGWVETMTSVARDEAAHLAQVIRLLIRRGGRLPRAHKNAYANALRLLVRKGEAAEIVDRLFVSALIELRSCERFAVLAAASEARTGPARPSKLSEARDGPAEADSVVRAISSEDTELSAFYRALSASEMGHYKLFLKLARKIGPQTATELRWQQMLASEARILSEQSPGPRIHSGLG
jgi:tRNA-(ms[2]io[6]A)-hydroxylase